MNNMTFMSLFVQTLVSCLNDVKHWPIIFTIAFLGSVVTTALSRHHPTPYAA